MAFDTATRNSQYQAISLLDALRTIYRECKTAQGMLQLYQANTDPIFNAAINVLHPPNERQHLGQMLTQINALILDWEANHPAALGL